MFTKRQDELLAVVRAEHASTVAAATGAKSLTQGALAAVIVPAESGAWRSRARIGRALVARQRLLEQAHAAAPLLPAAPGCAVEDDAASRAFLIANADMLRAGLDTLGDCEQHQATIDVAPDLVVEKLQRTEAWAAIAATARDAGPKAAAARMAEAAAALRAELAATAATVLRRVSQDMAELPPATEHTALNAVFLTERGGSPAVEAVLEELDALWNGRLSIKLIGPAPASSFASVALEAVDQERAASAAAELGVTLSAAPKEVTRAYHAAIAAAHPDRVGANGEARARRVNAAGALMIRIAAAAEACRAAGMGDAAALAAPLARLLREGETSAATTA